MDQQPKPAENQPKARGGRPPLDPDDKTVQLSFKLPASILARLDAVTPPAQRSDTLRDWTCLGIYEAELAAITDAKRRRWADWTVEWDDRVAQTRSEFSLDELLREQLDVPPQWPLWRDWCSGNRAQVFGPLTRMFAGLNGLTDAENVRFHLTEDSEVEVNIVDGETVHEKMTDVTIWCEGTPWQRPATVATATVKMTSYQGGMSYTGHGVGKITCGDQDGSNRTAITYTGESAAHFVADLLPGLLARQAAADIMGLDGPEHALDDLPTPQDALRTLPCADQIAEVIAARAEYLNLCDEAFAGIDQLVDDRHDTVDPARAEEIAAILTEAGWTPELRETRDEKVLWAVRRDGDRLDAVNAELGRLRGWDWVGVRIPADPRNPQQWPWFPENDVFTQQFVCRVK